MPVLSFVFVGCCPVFLPKGVADGPWRVKCQVLAITTVVTNYSAVGNCRDTLPLSTAVKIRAESNIQS